MSDHAVQHSHDEEDTEVTVEARVRRLENWRAFVIGMGTAFGLIITVTSGYIGLQVHEQRVLLYQVAIKVGVQPPL